MTLACPGGGEEATQLGPLSLAPAPRAAAAGKGPSFVGEQWCQPAMGEARLDLAGPRRVHLAREGSTPLQSLRARESGEGTPQLLGPQRTLGSLELNHPIDRWENKGPCRHFNTLTRPRSLWQSWSRHPGWLRAHHLVVTHAVFGKHAQMTMTRISV